MELLFLKSKLHRATVTDANLNYEGSISIDPEMMRAAEIRPFEKVDVVNINNGARFTTYAITGKKDSGEICLNGAAARLAHVGDKVIIITYAQYEEVELADYSPLIVLLGDENHIKSIERPNPGL